MACQLHARTCAKMFAKIYVFLRFVHGPKGNGLLRHEAYQVPARTDGFFCKVERFE